MEGYPVRIQGDPAVIGDITELLDESSEAQSVRVDEDSTGGIGADFALETIATITAIVSSLFFQKPIVPSLLAILRKKEGTKITIESPVRTVTIQSNRALTPAALEDIIGAVLTPDAT